MQKSRVHNISLALGDLALTAQVPSERRQGISSFRK